MKRSRRSLSRKLTWACPCVLVLLAQPARANDPEPCAVRLSPPGTAEAWRGAAQRLEQRMRTLTQPSTDCHDISLEVAESQATLTLVTLDGRRAVRAIASPDELVPSAEALLVVPPVVAEEPVAPTRVAAAPAGDGVSILFTAAGGVRLALPGDYASPTVGAAVGVSFGRWDLGLSGQWDAVHEALGDAEDEAPGSAPKGSALSSLTVAASLGRREPVGNVSILYGAQLGLSFFSTRVSAWSYGLTYYPEDRFIQAIIVSESKVERQLGGYFGVVLPADSTIRFRPGLTVDVLPSHIGEKLDFWAPIPWLSTALTFGVEGELL